MYKRIFFMFLLLIFIQLNVNAITDADIYSELNALGYKDHFVLYDNNIVVAEQNGKYAFFKIDCKENIKKLISPDSFIYDKIEKINIGNDYGYTEQYFYKTTKDGKVGAFDKYGCYIPAEYDNIEVKYSKEGKYSQKPIFIVTNNNQKGAYTLLFDWYYLYVPIQFDDISCSYINNKVYFIVTKNGKKGLYNSIKPQFDDIIPTDDNFVIVKQNGNTGLIQIKDDNVEVDALPSKYQMVTLNSKKGVLEGSKKIIPVKYDNIEVDALSSKYQIVTLNGKKGVLEDSKKIIPIKYDEIFKLPDYGVFIVKKNNKYGTVRANFEVEVKTVPIEYDSIIPVTRGYIVEKNKKYGVYHTKIGKLEDAKYDEITIENDTLLQCKINGNVVKTVDMNEKSLSEKYYDSAFVKSGEKVLDRIFLWWVPGMASTW